MENENQTGFIILGFSDFPRLRIPIFLVFLITYISTLAENAAMIAVIYTNRHLHKPMYLFLGNLSTLDICYTSVIFPKMLIMLIDEKRHVSYLACYTQLYFFVGFASAEFFLLTVMAYDRYIAICKPLHYFTIMNKEKSIIITTGTWVAGLCNSAVFSSSIAKLPLCSHTEINHFFCDMAALLKLTCRETHRVEIIIYTKGVLIGLSSFFLTLTSYVYIISTILKISSSEGRSKAFSTCASHLTVVILFYGTIMCMYMRPTSSYSLSQDKIFSLLYVVITPLVNPLIYCLRNQDVKWAITKRNTF
ncbi:olfactory receptor 5V1-like [Rhinophrynus dorsalis]